MAIQISGTTVINDSRQLQNVASLDATTTASIKSAVGGGASITAVASGTLANGDTVILNSNGTVSAITGSEIAGAKGSDANFPGNMASSGDTACVFDSNSNKIFAVYNNNLTQRGVVGTVSGTTITWTGDALISSARPMMQALSYDSSQNRILYVTYSTSPYYGKARVITISGTSFSSGSEYTFNSDETINISVVYDTNAGKHLIFYGHNFNDTAATVVTMSGTSLSFGSRVTLTNTHNPRAAPLVYDASVQKIVVFYQQTSSLNGSRFQVLTISGTSVSAGTPLLFGLANTIMKGGAYNVAKQKSAFSYYDTGFSGNPLQVIVVSVSGTTPSIGNPITLAEKEAQYAPVNYDPDSEKIIVTWRLSVDGTGQYAALDMSGTSLELDASGVGLLASGANFNMLSSTFDTNAKKLVNVFRDGLNGYGGGNVIQIAYADTNVKNFKFLGISDASYSNGQTATIQCVGSVDDAQSGLTAGTPYYVLADGSLGTDPSSFIPDSLVGIALSSSSILVKG